jgi:hypothetical protein
MSKKYVPEFEVRERRKRAGFLPGYETDEPELWQLYCRRDSDGEQRRATTKDMKRAGFVPRKRGVR